MILNPYPGKLIAWEGIDASGKSYQFLRNRNYTSAYHPRIAANALFTKEPDIEHESGQEIYDILLGRPGSLEISEMHPFEMQCHYFRNRIWHYKYKVIPALERGSHVFTDRSLASMCFGVSSPAEFRPLMAIQAQAFLGAEVPFVWPDMILIYDIPAQVAKERLLAQGKELDAFEKNLDFQVRVRENYLTFASQYTNCHVIDASGAPEDIFIVTKNIVFPFLGVIPSPVKGLVGDIS